MSDSEIEFSKPRNGKAYRAMEMKATGFDLETICEVVGFPSNKEAQAAINRALREELGSDPKARDRARAMVNRQLERLMRSVAVKALDPDHPEHLPAVGRMRELIADHRKLFGLDAPSQVVVHNPSDSEIEKWVIEMKGMSGEDLEEFDILEGEVIEESESTPALREA